MRTYFFRFAGGAALALAMWCLAGSGDAQDKAGAHKRFLPPEAYQKLVTRTAKTIQSNLAKPDDEDNLHRAQALAALVAGYAHCAEEGPSKVAGVEGSAWHLCRIAMDKAKIAEAKKLAAGLAQLQGLAQANESLLGKCPEDLGDLMNLLKPKAKGGLGMAPELQSNARLKGALNGIEEKIRALAMKKSKDAQLGKESKELSLLAFELAVLGELTYRYPAPRKGKGQQKDWQELSFQMRDASLDLAAAAAKKDVDATYNAANKLNSSCSQCHSLFR
jgi:hypothetical protein